MKKYRIIFYIGVVMSMLVGAWHFFVPYMFRWYSYIPRQYGNLIVGIDWTNLCFSLLLFGTSLLVLLWSGRVFSGNHEALILYGFLTFVWFFRVALAIIEPWPLVPIAWAARAQLAGAALVMLLLLVPFVKLMPQLKKPRS